MQLYFSSPTYLTVWGYMDPNFQLIFTLSSITHLWGGVCGWFLCPYQTAILVIIIPCVSHMSVTDTSTVMHFGIYVCTVKINWYPYLIFMEYPILLLYFHLPYIQYPFVFLASWVLKYIYIIIRLIFFILFYIYLFYYIYIEIY